MSRDNAHLRDILDSALAIRRYLDGIGREQFEQNAEKQDAVIRRFEIMGGGGAASVAGSSSGAA